jgi:oxygen-independent coproporphyrinogen III oxidase
LADSRSAARGPSVVGLYLHVPFCTDKCLYCDFYSVPHRTVPRTVQARVVEETLREAETFRAALGPGSAVSTVFVGGGTPSILSRDHLARILEFCRGSAAAEWTVEANPETVDGEFLALCSSAGVSRLSLGVQSLSDAHLSLLRRSAGRTSTLKGVELVSQRWQRELNLDFIAGIPGQTAEDVREDLRLLDRVRPGHVSLYQLTREQGTPLARLVEDGRIVPNSPEVDEELWFAGREELMRRGYEHYEISNFALPGKACLHNLCYWRIDPYIGAGPGAVSTLPAREMAPLLGAKLPPGATGVVRLTNPRDIPAFLKGREALWGLEVEHVDPRDFLMETLMMGLRVSGGLETAVFERRFGRDFDELFPGLWSRWQDRGWALPVGGQRALTAEGRMIMDGLVQEADEVFRSRTREPLIVSWP